MKIKVKKYINNHKSIILTFLIFFIPGLFLFLGNVLAIPAPIEKITFSSKELSYEENEEGSWKVDKSARWTGRGKARITFDVDTKRFLNDNINTDIVLMIDNSSSMSIQKLQKVKDASINLISKSLEKSKNRVSIITFNSISQILSNFSNNKTELNNIVQSISSTGSTNYYQAFIKLDELLKDYEKEENKELVAIFLTDSKPSLDTPNEIGQYQYLKDQYKYLNIKAIQYEMGDKILDNVKKVSDEQHIASMNTLDNVLIDVALPIVSYDELVITDYINTKYFEIASSNDIAISQGNVKLEENSKIIWDLSSMLAGNKAQMTIDISLKDEYKEVLSVFETNNKEEVLSNIAGVEEKISSTETPILSTNFKIIYESNVPNGCTIEGDIPKTKEYSTFDTIHIEDAALTCEGYQFKGWEVVNKEDTEFIGDDYIRSYGNNIVVRAVWSKIDINISMNGTVHQVKSVLQATPTDVRNNRIYRNKMWKDSYRIKTTKIVLQKELDPIDNAVESWDISAEEDGSVMAYAVLNEDNNTYTIYMQGNGKIEANEDSSGLFYNFTKLESLEGLEYLDTSEVKNMHAMFYKLGAIESLDLSNFDTSNVTDMSYMFYDYNSSKPLDLSNFNTSKVTNMEWMFLSCDIYELNLSSFDTSKVTSMNRMFSGFNSSVPLDLSNFDTSNVTDMGSMFTSYSSSAALNLSNFDTSKVTNMSTMFYGYKSSAPLDLSSFDTSNVTDMSSMFGEYSSSAQLDLSNFDTSKVTNMRSMFSGYKNFAPLNLSNFDTSNVTNMGSMFYKYSGSELDLSNFDTSKVTNMSSMFENYESSAPLNLSSFDTSNVTNMSYMFEYYDTSSQLDLKNFNTSNVTDMSYMFYGYKSSAPLDLSNFDTSNVTNMKGMFREYNNSSPLDLSNFNTSKVTDMSSMFYDFKGSTLDLSNFDTSNVIDMSHMFTNYNGSSNPLGLSKFNTSNVTNMSYMFLNYKVSYLDLSNFDTSNVTNMRSMFSNYKGSYLDLSNFDTSNVTNMSAMFSGYNGSYLDLSNFDTSNVTNMSSMFSNYSSSAPLDLKNFDTSNVTNMRSMFYQFQGSTLDLSSFNTSNVTDMSSMFREYDSSYSLDLSNFDTSNVTNMSYMFYQFYGSELDLSSFYTSNVTNISYIFYYCPNLKKLNFKNATFNKVTKSTNMFSHMEDLEVLVSSEQSRVWIQDKLGDHGTAIIFEENENS